MPQWSFDRFVSVGEQLPVDLYDGEEERRADAEQQHTVHRFQGADHLEPGRQRQSRYFERRHGGQGIDGRCPRTSRARRATNMPMPTTRPPARAGRPVSARRLRCGRSRSESPAADQARVVSTRTRILVSRPNAINTTAVVWIAMVSTMSERPRLQLERSTRLPYHRPRRQTATSTEVDWGSRRRALTGMLTGISDGRGAGRWP